MVGRIEEKSIAEVREKARIDEIIGSHVTLRNAGSGSLKGLCPFHDEKTPSFHVTPSRGFYHCFGCQAGGDVINFVMEVDGLSFAEAVERLADRAGVQLQREDGDDHDDRPRGPGRGKLVEANRLAREFYADQLTSPDALAARQFLAERGFDRDSAEHFGLGFAPRDGEALLRHLRQKGFSVDELVAAGLVAVGRSPYDRFRGRLLWPIREPGGDTLGFGARRIFDDDRIDAKYLNTPETAIYKKGQVLYGIDLARKEMARTSQAVVVEGYTDVMACHLSGVGTAVATCGTAFGDDHARILRRFMADHEEFRGEVIFTFDGDSAGKQAAVRAFEGDQNFVSQTYVAVEPSGMDPCELRIAEGDAAVRELVARRVPLYRFVLDNVVSRYDLDRADSRVDALRAGAKLVTSVRDRAKVDAFARELASMVGVDVEDASSEVRRAARRGPETSSGRRAPEENGEQEARPAAAAPSLHDPRYVIERETLKLAIQHPMVVGRTTTEIGPEDFTHPAYRAVWQLIEQAGGTAAGVNDAGWANRIRDAAGGPDLASVISALAVEPIHAPREPDGPYVEHHVVRLLELTAARRIADVKSKLQRTNPVEEAAEYNRMFGELAALEQHRRGLRDRLVATG